MKATTQIKKPLSCNIATTMTIYIGQIVDYYSTPSERNAAIVINTHATGIDERPTIDLQVFQPDGKIRFLSKIPPVDISESLGEEPTDLEGHWAFQHEFAVQQEADHDTLTEEGINSNQFVGSFATSLN